MSATAIIETAPLGALTRYTDAGPKPPTIFTKTCGLAYRYLDLR